MNYPPQQGPGFSNDFQFAPIQNNALQYAQRLAGGTGGGMQGAMSGLAQLVALLKKKRMLDALNGGGSSDIQTPDWVYNAQSAPSGDLTGAGGA